MAIFLNFQIFFNKCRMFKKPFLAIFLSKKLKDHHILFLLNLQFSKATTNTKMSSFYFIYHALSYSTLLTANIKINNH